MRSAPLFLGVFLSFLCVHAIPAAAPGETLGAKIVTQHGPLKPESVPVLEPLSLGHSAYGSIGRLAGPGDYEPTGDGGFRRHNGSGVFNYIVTSGAWWLQVGDKPRVLMTLRTPGGAYAAPALLPGLGVGGQLRLAVSVEGKSKWLDAFDSIDATLAPGSGHWTCSDKELGVAIELGTLPFISNYGFAATARVVKSSGSDVALTWVLGNLGGETDVVQVKRDETTGSSYTLLSTPGLPYTEVYAGLFEPGARVRLGDATLPDDAPKPCAMLSASPLAQGESSRFVCVWGYSNYDRAGVDAAYKRLEFRPFADLQWVEEMKKNWFQHWIGKGLQPEKKFLETRANPVTAIDESLAFWGTQRNRVRIKTPEPRFDNVVRSVGALMRMQFEYPSFIHGLTYCKYGKINCGYYGMSAAGYHDEVASSLKFISGTQCVKGRQRYFMPAFSLSPWSEEVDFYFVDQVWHHYRWTGDREFLRTMWPAARRTLEHGLEASDPDGDGIMTGYYEMWNADTYARGGKCALHTAMAWAALRAGAEIASIFADKDHDSHGSSIQGPFPPEFGDRYRKLMERSENVFERDLWNPEVGAWCSAEWNGDMRPHPANHEENYPIWRGLGQPMRQYMAMRYVRDRLQIEESPGVVGEFNNLWWPIMWSHHYVANGDTAASIASACAAGDIDHFWPALKTIYESAFTNGNATLYHATGSHSQESETLFTLAVIEGIFGVQPYFGDNLLVVRPSLPSAWPTAEIALQDAAYAYSKSDGGVTLDVTTPVFRRVRAELPVRSAIKSVTVNGEPASYRIEKAVNGCRVAIESPVGQSHHFEVRTASPEARVEGSALVHQGAEARFTVENARILQIHDPQGKMRDIAMRQAAGDGATVASFVPTETGKYTVFLELSAGDAVWFHPLDLDVRKRWEIAERFVPGLTKGGPSVASPNLDIESRTMAIQIQNNAPAPLVGKANLTVAGVVFAQNVEIPASSTQTLSVSLDGVWERLSPGSVPVAVELDGATAHASAVSWRIGKSDSPAFRERLRPIDLAPYCNVNLRHLYSPDFQWRIDYAGCGEGVDWRDPMPERDAIGYVIMNAPVSQFEYGVLIEQFQCTNRWDAPALSNPFPTPFGVAFRTGGEVAPPDEGAAGEAKWLCVRSEGSANSWKQDGAVAVMSVEGGAEASNGWAYGPLAVTTEAGARLRVKLSGTPNARFFINASGPSDEVIFRSEWLETPTEPEERSYAVQAGKEIRQILIYTRTKDGKRAENRIESLLLETGNQKIALDLEDLNEPAPVSLTQKDVLALISTEPYEQIPSQAAIQLESPVALEKIYLLTANLTKTLKCYYPGAEVVVRYDTGEPQVVELVPPYTMSCFVQQFCPRAYAIPFGSIVNGAHPLNKGKDCHLAVSDLTVDPSRKVREIELRCVASETVLGVVGLTVLEAAAR